MQINIRQVGKLMFKEKKCQHNMEVLSKIEPAREENPHRYHKTVPRNGTNVFSCVLMRCRLLSYVCLYMFIALLTGKRLGTESFTADVELKQWFSKGTAGGT